jgi:signal peptidase II
VLVGSRALSAVARSQRFRAYLIIVGTGAGVMVIDHLTKWLVVQHLPVEGQLFPTSPISITHVQNRGAAFGILPQFQWLYLGAAVVVASYILIAGHRFGTSPFRQFLLGMILGGAVSNGFDRLTQGYVVDFIDLHRWPVFNVADMSIVVGILLAILTFSARSPRASPS